jgi:hypothetical protein
VDGVGQRASVYADEVNMKKPVVWYVDDLPSNLEKFTGNHQRAFTIRTFHSPDEVIAALAESQPDALLCDVFFYDSVVIAEDMERRVRERAEQIQRFGEEIGANKLANQAGIPLIQSVASRFGKSFPIYAYTSKSPYLLDNLGFDRIGNAGARWLFKGKYSSSTEQIIIQQDIEEFRSVNSLSMRIGQIFWVALFGSGILGGLVVWFLTDGLPKLFR